MKSVFVLQHLNLLPPDDEEDIKMIGVYRSREEGLAAIERLKGKSGFCDHARLVNPLIDNESRGFYLSEYELGKDHWVEGFIAV